MSARSEIVKNAIFAKSNVSAVVGAGKLTAIYAGSAPDNAVMPYGIIQRQANEPNVYGFGNPTTVLQGDIWTLKVVTDTGATGKSPAKHAEDLKNVWLATLGNTLTLAGGVLLAWMAVEQDAPDQQELVSDRWIYHRGTMLRIRTQN